MYGQQNIKIFTFSLMVRTLSAAREIFCLLNKPWKYAWKAFLFCYGKQRWSAAFDVTRIPQRPLCGWNTDRNNHQTFLLHVQCLRASVHRLKHLKDGTTRYVLSAVFGLHSVPYHRTHSVGGTLRPETKDTQLCNQGLRAECKIQIW